MKLALICKRHYTNKDLLADRFGRLYHLPAQLGLQGHESLVLAVDYRCRPAESLNIPGVTFHSLPLPHLWMGYRRLCDFRPDLLLASGDSHFGGLGLAIARRLGISFVFDVYDDYRVFGTNRLPGMKTLFVRAVRGADAVICVSQGLARQLAALNQNVAIIENGVDPFLFRSIPRTEARRTLDLPNDVPIVGFFGSIDRNHGVEDLLAAAKRLRSEFPHLRVLLAGRNWLGLDFTRPGVDYRGLLPQAQIPWLINACDVVAVPNRADPQWNVCGPCKLAEYLACGMPIVATRISDNANLLSAAPQGLCAPGDPDALAEAIRAQLKKPQRVPLTDGLTWSALGRHLEKTLTALLRRQPVETVGESPR